MRLCIFLCDPIWMYLILINYPLQWVIQRLFLNFGQNAMTMTFFWLFEVTGRDQLTNGSGFSRPTGSFQNCFLLMSTKYENPSEMMPFWSNFGSICLVKNRFTHLDLASKMDFHHFLSNMGTQNVFHSPPRFFQRNTGIFFPNRLFRICQFFEPTKKRWNSFRCRWWSVSAMA